ncbi:helix-hairpin-helix domain-containing protein [Oxalobacteraceae bacterium R-40]|uniref:Helix-hairpin-helix domain-containing protein n=1 Tax=Keguizhuia sedimenti TaxID=3064264 RepID=A0ABU1BSE2_9BURK|nr:helix-hairpin-helix domain-containing protein [Oxalobacteraceae bacterium R-40]
MKKLFKSMGLLAGAALLAAGLVHAKDEAKASDSANKATPSEKSSAAASQASPSGAMTSDKAKSDAQIDINTATEKELAGLPKIGEVKAKAIVKGRPYKSKDQLVDKKILSQEAYDSIKDQIIAKQGTSTKDSKKDVSKDSKK